MDFLQVVSFLLAIATLYLVIFWMKKNPDISGYGVSVVFWLGHTIIFYGMVFVNRELFDTGIDYTAWSRYLRFHAIFSLFFSFCVLNHTYLGIIGKLRGIRLWMKSHFGIK